MDELDNLIGQKAEQGQYDSEGQFTLDPDKALKKVRALASLTPHRYVLELMSILIRGGASRIEITISPNTMIWLAPGARFTESQSRMLAPAFEVGVEQLEFQPEGEEPSWCLTPEGTRSSPSEFEGAVKITFSPTKGGLLRYFLSQLRGPETLRKETRLLASFGRRCPVPLVVDGERFDTRVDLPVAPVYAVVGNREDLAENLNEPIRVDSEVWSGCFSLIRGRLELVVDGVLWMDLPGSSMSGVIYHDKLSLDLSRKAIVRDHIYQALWSDLERVRNQMLEHLALRIHDFAFHEIVHYLEPLSQAARQNLLSEKARETVRHWMEESLEAARHSSQTVRAYTGHFI